MQTQACLFAFPENHATRIQLELLLVETYSHLAHMLSENSTEQNAQSIHRWNEMIQPFSEGIIQLLEEQELSEEQLGVTESRFASGCKPNWDTSKNRQHQ